MTTMLATSASQRLAVALQRNARTTTRVFSSAPGGDPFLPRVTDRKLEEQGPGGRSSVAGIKVAIFGATGFLGKHVCNLLGTFVVGNFGRGGFAMTLDVSLWRL